MKNLIVKNRFLIALVVALALLLSSCSTRLHTGWYSTAKLKKMGYTVPKEAPKNIYIRRTTDINKANVTKN